MDPRVFLLICLAAAFRPQPSSVLEVDPNDPQNDAYNETDFQALRDIVNGDKSYWKPEAAGANMWPSFLKAHPEEGWHLFKKIAQETRSARSGWVRQKAAISPAWPMLLQTHTAEAWQLFQELAQDEDGGVREKAAESPAWPILLETHHAEAWQLFQKLATDDKYWQGRRGAAISPAWPMLLQTHTAEAWQLFQKLAKDKSAREAAAISPAWPMLLQTHNAAAWQLFQKLATEDKSCFVREKAATSPAWPMLLQTHNAAAWQLFQKLAKDDEYVDVRKAAATSPAWPDLVKSNQWESWQVLAEIMSNREFVHLASLPVLAESPAWKAFGNVPLTGVAEHLKSFTPTNLQEMAMSAQKVADNGFRHKVKDLPVVKGVATTLQRSSNETWLGEMAELPLFARNAAQRLSPAQDVSTVLTSKFEYPAKE